MQKPHQALSGKAQVLGPAVLRCAVWCTHVDASRSPQLRFIKGAKRSVALCCAVLCFAVRARALALT